MTEPFDRFAGQYDELLRDPLRDRFAESSRFFIEQKCRVLLRHLPKRGPSAPKLRVLDAGCGQGTALAFVGGETRPFGADVSLPMLREAVRLRPVAVQEPFDLPFRDATFDAAFAFCVYHHIDDSQHVRHLRELSRVVVPGGRVLIFEHNPYNPVTRVVFNRAPIDRGCHMIPPPLLRRTFRQAGLEDIRHGYLLFLPEALWRLFGAVERALSWLPLGGQYFVSGRTPGPSGA